MVIQHCPLTCPQGNPLRMTNDRNRISDQTDNLHWTTHELRMNVGETNKWVAQLVRYYDYES